MGRLEAIHRHMRQQAAATASTRLLDRFGTAVHPGDMVLVVPGAQVFRLVKAERELDPRVPAGLLHVVLRAELDLRVPAGQPIMDFIFNGELTAVVAEAEAKVKAGVDKAVADAVGDVEEPPQASSADPPAHAPADAPPADPPAGEILLTDRFQRSTS